MSFAPGSIADSSGTILSEMSSGTAITITTTVDTETEEEGESIASKTNILSWVLIVAILLLMIKVSYPTIVLLDLLQYAHMHIYVTALPLPYLYMKAFDAMGNVNFTFLPTLYSNPSPDTSLPYYVFQPDSTFLGNCQPFIFFLGIFLTVYLIFFGLSRKCFPVKCMRVNAKKAYKRRMRFSFLYEMFYYPAFYVLFFALYQFTGANSNISESNGNLVFAIIVVMAYGVWLVALTYVAVQYKSRMDDVPQKHSIIAL